MKKPADLGFRMPAEWARHAATWLSWPHEPTTWPGKLPQAEGCMARWVRALAPHERVDINVLDATHERHVREFLQDWDVDLTHVHLHHVPTADVWIRDYGPSFVTRATDPGDGFGRVAAVGWEFDAWGGKGPGYYGPRAQRDRLVARRVAELAGVRLFEPGLVLEGGGIEVNGEGMLMATRDCLLTHRGRADGQADMEEILHDYLGVDHVLWLENVAFEGDDTDGHIDNLARFVGPDRVATAVAQDATHPLYDALRDNVRRLEMSPVREVVVLPLPSPFHFRWQPPSGKVRQQFPASYMNFYIGNEVVLVPVFGDKNDVQALATLAGCFPDRTVVPVDCCDYILGQGAIHCSTQQQPLPPEPEVGG